MIGPSMDESPMTGPKKAKADPSSSGAKTLRMIPRPWGISKAAAVPWARRQPMSMAGLTANPQATEAATKPRAPTTKIRLRP